MFQMILSAHKNNIGPFIVARKAVYYLLKNIGMRKINKKDSPSISKVDISRHIYSRSFMLFENRIVFGLQFLIDFYHLISFILMLICFTGSKFDRWTDWTTTTEVLRWDSICIWRIFLCDRSGPTVGFNLFALHILSPIARFQGFAIVNKNESLRC